MGLQWGKTPGRVCGKSQEGNRNAHGDSPGPGQAARTGEVDPMLKMDPGGL